jgi:hypothetical protein
VIAWKAMSPAAEPIAAPVPKSLPTVVEPPKPAKVEVRFEIASEPSGATVTRDGVQIGVTPFQLTVPRVGAQPVQVELSFSLEGYEPRSATAQGLDGVVTVNQALSKKAEPRPQVKPLKKPKNPKTEPSGYKDDPY